MVGDTGPVFGFAKYLADLLETQFRKYPPHKDFFIGLCNLVQDFPDQFDVILAEKLLFRRSCMIGNGLEDAVLDLIGVFVFF